jgi:hypothetical protein
VIAGQDGMIACHSHLNGGVWTKVTKIKRTKAVSYNSGIRSINRAFNHDKATLRVVLANPDYVKVVESYTMLPAINSEQ